MSTFSYTKYIPVGLVGEVMVITVCVLTGVETMGTIVPVLMAIVVVTELTVVSVNRIYEHFSLTLNIYL